MRQPPLYRHAGTTTLAILITLIGPSAWGQGANNGTLYYSQDENGNGLYTLDTGTGQATLVGAGITTVTSTTVGLAESSVSTELFGSKASGLLRIQSDGSGAATTGATQIEGLAFDPVNNVLYGAAGGSFFTVNQATGAILTTLAAPGADMEGLAWAPTNGGTIYGTDEPGNLRAYSISSGTWALIGSLGIGFDDSGLAYDPIGNVLYGIRDQDQNLYRINPTNAALTSIGPRNINSTVLGGGLAFVPNPVGAVAPETGSGMLLAAGAVLAAVTFRPARTRQRH